MDIQNYRELNLDALDIAIDEIQKHLSIPDYYLTVNHDANLNSHPRDNCPFDDHDDSTASFTYFADTETFYCFGCGKGGKKKGTVVHLHYLLTKEIDPTYSVVKSVYDLSREYHIKIPDLYSIPKELVQIRSKQIIKPVSRDSIKLPQKVYKRKAEEYLKQIKKVDNGLYIQFCNVLDNATLLELDYEQVLNKLMKYAKGVENADRE